MNRMKSFEELKQVWDNQPRATPRREITVIYSDADLYRWYYTNRDCLVLVQNQHGQHPERRARAKAKGLHIIDAAQAVHGYKAELFALFDIVAARSYVNPRRSNFLRRNVHKG